MKIIILGAGQVGGTLAENLINENNDITIIDNNFHNLKKLQDKFDLRVILGHCSYPHILYEAGAEDADMLIAVTNSDEVNMISCQIAYSLFDTPNRIARIRSQNYIRESKKIFQTEVIPINYLISPEQLVIDYIYKLIEFPGSLQIINFFKEKINILAVRAYINWYFIGKKLSSIHKYIQNIDTRIISIFRNNHSIKIKGSTIIEIGDEIFFICDSKYTRTLMDSLQQLEKSYKKIMIVGGGNIGSGLARKLEKLYNIKLIELNKKRAIELSKQLHNTIVFCGNASDQELLIEEHINKIDVFISTTNNDEVNIMSAMLAKRMGAKKVIVLIQRHTYINLIQNNIIDITISPQQITISALLNHIRNKNIINVSLLHCGKIEIIEAIVYNYKNTSKIINHTIKQVNLPPGTTIGAIARDNNIIISDRNYKIQQGDHVIMSISDRKNIHDIEKLFQPNLYFDK
ncbi:Trk system potassium uptake protein TrkA [Serratia symbiotica]|nr:Trk system potassium uptake protein TrkA [Serratia symbiotica]